MQTCTSFYPKIKRLLYTHGYTHFITFVLYMSYVLSRYIPVSYYFITNASYQNIHMSLVCSSIRPKITHTYTCRYNNNNRRKSGICVETTFDILIHDKIEFSHVVHVCINKWDLTSFFFAQYWQKKLVWLLLIYIFLYVRTYVCVSQSGTRWRNWIWKENIFGFKWKYIRIFV